MSCCCAPVVDRGDLRYSQVRILCPSQAPKEKGESDVISDVYHQSQFPMLCTPEAKDFLCGILRAKGLTCSIREAKGGADDVVLLLQYNFAGRKVSAEAKRASDAAPAGPSSTGSGPVSAGAAASAPPAAAAAPAAIASVASAAPAAAAAAASASSAAPLSTDGVVQLW